MSEPVVIPELEMPELADALADAVLLHHNARVHDGHCLGCLTLRPPETLVWPCEPARHALRLKELLADARNEADSADSGAGT